MLVSSTSTNAPVMPGSAGKPEAASPAATTIAAATWTPRAAPTKRLTAAVAAKTLVDRADDGFVIAANASPMPVPRTTLATTTGAG